MLKAIVIGSALRLKHFLVVLRCAYFETKHFDSLLRVKWLLLTNRNTSIYAERKSMLKILLWCTRIERIED